MKTGILTLLMRTFFIPLVLLFPVCGAAAGAYRLATGDWPAWKVIAAAVTVILVVLVLCTPNTSASGRIPSPARRRSARR